MRHLHGFGACQVGDGAGDFQAAVNAPARPAEPRRRNVQEFRRRRVKLALRIDRLAFERLVGAALAAHRALPGLRDAAADGVARLAGRRVHQFVGGQAADFDMQVDPVQQRAAELALVARDLVGRAAAGAQIRAQIAARARVHRGDELKARRKLGAVGGAGNRDVAGLQRLAQRFERGARKLGQFVEKQHAAVRQRDFAGARRRAAADQRHRAGGVMRRAGRPHRPLLEREAPAQRSDGSAFERFVGRHRGQQAGKALRQHRLARAGRAHHQNAVAAGGGDFERAAGGGLAFDIGQVQVHRLVRWRRRSDSRPAVQFRRRCVARQKLPDDVEQMVGAVNLGVGHQRRFLCAAFGQDQPGQRLAAVAGAVGYRQAHRQRAADRPQFAAEREFAGKFVAGQLARIDLAAGGQNAERDRQVEAARILGQVGRRQIYGDSFVAGKFQPGVLNRRAHPLTRLFDFGIGQPHQGKARQAVGQMHLDADRARFQAEQSPAMH